MSKEILLIESVIHVKDYNQGYIDCVETNIGMVKPLGHRDRPTRKELDDIIKCQVYDFKYYHKGQVHQYKMAWHPDFEKEISVPLDIIERQSFELEEVNNENIDLKIKLRKFESMKFWQRVKFAFIGRVEK